MPSGLDHIVIAVADPDKDVKRVAAELGVEPGGGGRHDRLGTFNRLVWLADGYLELIGVFDRALALESWLGKPTLRALDRGGGLATLAVASDDIEHDVQRLRAAGAILTDPMLGERRRPDGSTVRWWYSLPPRLGPDEPPFLIQHDVLAAEWTERDRATRAAGPARLLGVDLPVDNLADTAARFAQTLGLEWHLSGDKAGEMSSRLGPHSIRLDNVSRRPTIRIAIDQTPEGTFELLGCTWVVSG